MAIDEELCAAVRKGLADYLRPILQAQFGLDGNSNQMCAVRDHWLENRQKPCDFDVTVLTTGDADDWWLFPPSAKQVALGAPPQATVTYSYGFIDGLQLTLDLFTANVNNRKVLGRAVRNALNVPPWVSCPAIAQPKWLTLGHQNGLVLQLSTYFNTFAEFEFPAWASPIENAPMAQAGEFRSTLDGKATLFIRDQELFTALTRLGLTINTGNVTHTRTLPLLP